MKVDLIASQLLRLPLFRGLSLRQLHEIARNTQPLPCTPGAVIIEENGEADAAILIVEGDARRVSGPELKGRSEPVPVGSLLGEAAMLIETQYGSTVVAHGPVIAARLTRDRLHAMILKDPTIGERLTDNLASRLRRMADELRAVDALLGGGRELAADEEPEEEAMPARPALAKPVPELQGPPAP